VLHDAVEIGVAPGIVGGIANRGGILHMHAAGVQTVDPRVDMQIDSVFRIASMTKPVTSLGVMILVEEGKVDLDVPFAEYVPGYRQPEVLQSFDKATKRYATVPAQSRVTVRQLLTHTGGYGYWFMDAPLLALTKGVPDLLNPPFLMYPPGRKFSYSTSTDVLGQIFAPVAGMPIETFFERRIFAPLGMRDTGYSLPRDASRLVTVNARVRGAFAEQPNETRGNAPRGGGGLYSTAGDYLRFLRLLLNGGELERRRLLGRELVAAMTQNQIGELYADRQVAALGERSNDFVFMDGSQKFGFGVMIETRDQPTGRGTGSYSWGGIYNTYFWVDPSADLAGVILTQTTPFADPAVYGSYERFEKAAYDTRIPR
jgi:CubicO group peptidase (beta-lactamase class C family)